MSKKINKNVHWIFECGCEYIGKHYYMYDKKICKKHKKPIIKEIITCKDCNKVWEIKPKGAPPKYCSECQKKRDLKRQKNIGNIKKDVPKEIYDTKECVFIGCKKNVMPGNRMLCRQHYYEANKITEFAY